MSKETCASMFSLHIAVDLRGVLPVDVQPPLSPKEFVPIVVELAGSHGHPQLGCANHTGIPHAFRTCWLTRSHP